MKWIFLENICYIKNVFQFRNFQGNIFVNSTKSKCKKLDSVEKIIKMPATTSFKLFVRATLIIKYVYSTLP